MTVTPTCPGNRSTCLTTLLTAAASASSPDASPPGNSRQSARWRCRGSSRPKERAPSYRSASPTKKPFFRTSNAVTICSFPQLGGKTIAEVLKLCTLDSIEIRVGEHFFRKRSFGTFSFAAFANINFGFFGITVCLNTRFDSNYFFPTCNCK